MVRWTYTRGVLVGAVLGVAALALAGCGLSSTGTNGASAGTNSAQTPGLTTWSGASGPTLPAISGTTLTGAKFTPSQVSGRVLVVNAWASWCYPCESESPTLARVARQVAGKGVTFIGIDEQDTSGAALSFARKVGSPYSSIVDRSGSLLGSFRIVPATAIPSTIVIRPDGHVAARIIGPVTAGALLGVLRPLEQ